MTHVSTRPSRAPTSNQRPFSAEPPLFVVDLHRHPFTHGPRNPRCILPVRCRLCFSLPTVYTSRENHGSTLIRPSFFVTDLFCQSLLAICPQTCVHWHVAACTSGILSSHF